MALFLITLGSYLIRVMKRLMNQGIPVSNFTVFAFLMLVTYLGLNFTESNLLREHTFLWLPFLSIYTAMGMQDAYEKKKLVAETSRPVQQEEFAHQLA
jgi:O-antigen ligase